MGFEDRRMALSIAEPALHPVGLSIVVPVYRGAATVGRLVEALAALDAAGGLEVVLVNDGSPDNSGDVCRALAATATIPLTYIEHARNFGEHNAVMTGLRHARGAYVINMDDDLQNPPEEVIRLYDHARLGGWDVVYTRYAKKEHDGWRNLGSRFANSFMDRFLASSAYDGQQAPDKTEPMLPDNLYKPVAGDRGARGIFSDKALSVSPQVWMIGHRPLTAAIAGTIGVALAGATALAVRRR